MLLCPFTRSEYNPQAIYIYGYGKANGLVVKRVRELGYKGYILGSYNFSTEPTLGIAKEALEGAYFTCPPLDLNSPKKEVQNFIKGIEEKYKKLPLWNTTYEYDAIHILADTISKQGYSGEAILKGLKRIGNFNGIAWGYKWHSYGEWESELVIKTFKEGTQVVITK